MATKIERLAWKDAVEQYGETVLKTNPVTKLPYSHQRVSNWRRDGVPAHILLALQRDTSNAKLAAGGTDLVGAMDTIRAGIWQAWRSAGKEGSPKWEDMEFLLVSIVRTMSKKPT